MANVNNFKMKYFTKHINRELSDKNIVKDWCVYMTKDSEFLYLDIDYIEDFHSSDVFWLQNDLDNLKREFEHYYNSHVQSLYEHIAKRDQWNKISGRKITD